MKLTTEKIKQLVKEEYDKLTEATPDTFYTRGVVEIGFSKKNSKNKIKKKLPYFVYKSGNLEQKDVEGFVGEGAVGHYRVETGTFLHQKITSLEKSKPNYNQTDLYVIAIDDKKVLNVLLSTKNIKDQMKL